MRARAFAISVLFLLLPLAACGQKGPLYLDEQLPELGKKEQNETEQNQQQKPE